MLVKKRDGRIVEFDTDKILQSIKKAALAIECKDDDFKERANQIIEIKNQLMNSGFDPDEAEEKAEELFEGYIENGEYTEYDEDEATEIVDIVTESIFEMGDDVISTSDIQELVEKALIMKEHVSTAKEYMIRSANRERIREMNSSLMRSFEELTFGKSEDVETKRENANIDGDSSMGTMLKYGSEGAKKFNLLYVVPPEQSMAHRNGDIHMHDLDFYSLTETCCQIDLKKLYKDGFNTGHGFLREPGEIRSYAALACIAIQSNQNDMHGGQSIPNFDYYMAPGVAKTFVKEICEVLRVRYDVPACDFDEIKTALKKYNESHDYHIINTEGKRFVKRLINKELLNKGYNGIVDANKVFNIAKENTVKATHQAMEALVHNLNSMHSRAGAQVPFSSINYGTDITEEGRMVIAQLLNATEEGLGNGEIPIFPIQIFKIKDGVNLKKGNPNYDLFHRACEVSAKRLFPNFSNLDAPYNAQYYKEGDIDTEIAYMGCVEKNEIITYKINNVIYVESFGRAYERVFKHTKKTINYGESEYIDTTSFDISVYDGHAETFVKCRKFIKNPNKKNWKLLRLENGKALTLTEDHPLPIVETGRTFARDIEVGKHVTVNKKPYVEHTDKSVNAEFAWLLGIMLKNSSYAGNIIINLGNREEAIVNKISGIAKNLGYIATVIDKTNKHGTRYIEISLRNNDLRVLSKRFKALFGGTEESARHIPNEIFRAPNHVKLAFLSGVFDVENYAKLKDDTDSNYIKYDISFRTSNKELALQMEYLINSLGSNCKMKSNKANDTEYFYIKFSPIDKLNDMVNKIKYNGIRHADKVESYVNNEVAITSINDINVDSFSYDVETESDRFDVSGILSHNCRTRVIANAYDPSNEKVTRRGNLSFTSINLPRLGIRANGDINLFFNLLDDMMELVHKQLLDRFEVQCRKHPRNYPFLMGQGLWEGSENLGPDDSIREILKHGTLTVGFIGLAECLKALKGKHHGESEDSQEIGLKIIGYMRKLTDKWSKEEKMNYSVIATPAEGLSGRFIKLDKQKFGIIEGVTDRDYYTNSMHVPVYYPISAFKKINIEAPYHELCNGGHITYIELDGDPSKNISAFEKIIVYMHDKGIGYGAINHPVDRDPICGYTGIINDVCPRCGRREGEPMTDEMWKKLKGYAEAGKISNYGTLGNPKEEAQRISNTLRISDDK